jgi:ribosomal protein S15P/S13E
LIVADKTQQVENDNTGADIKVMKHLKTHLRNLIRHFEDNPKDFAELQVIDRIII